MKILVLGVNGFIGNQLVKKALAETDWEFYGLDLTDNKLQHSLDSDRFHFLKGSVYDHMDWVEEKVQECDVILPLIAVATPATYVTDPMKVFNLDFESNLPIIRMALKYDKHLVFPSTSEVYGMSSDDIFDEETSTLSQGPINKERWIYSCCKQLLDRVIYAYGNHDNLRFTLFRPFNWIGPTQDDMEIAKKGGARVVTQFISNIMEGKDLQTVDGGLQRRSFTYIEDGIAGLMKIIENKDNCAMGRIFNIGNPANNASIKELAELVLELAPKYPKSNPVKISNVESGNYYGKNYQDVPNRTPSIENAKKYLGWEPTTDFRTAIDKTLAYYLG